MIFVPGFKHQDYKYERAFSCTDWSLKGLEKDAKKKIISPILFVNIY